MKYFKNTSYRKNMKAVITVIGKDMVGILAKVSTACADANANVAEVTQSVLEEYFAMVMLVDIEKMTCSLEDLKNSIKETVPSMTVHVMHEDIFNSMHRI
ncbi:MAG: ACT domain-containing protein [Anaerovoracaceae bacterium]